MAVTFDVETRWPELFARLSARERAVVIDALASGWHEGWVPDRADVQNLTDLAGGAIDQTEYDRRVAEAAGHDPGTGPDPATSDRFDTWDSYLWEPGGSVLRNLFGERDGAAFQRMEFCEVFARQREIDTGEVDVRRSYDAGHLRAIHTHLFARVYPWAGQYRTVTRQREAAPGGFADAAQIDRYLADAHKAVLRTDWPSLDRGGFASAAAVVFAYVNQAHPFREGNGPTSKLFMKHVAELSSFAVVYDPALSGVTPEIWNQASLLSGPDLGRYEPVPDSLVPVFRALARPRSAGAPAAG